MWFRWRLSQAVSLSHRLNWGLQAQDVGEPNFYTLRTVDLDGEPFIDITVSSPVVANGFWDLAFSVSGDEWDPEDFESPWTTSLTGASTARDVLVVGNVGLSLPMRMAATVTALGGLENVLEVVAIEQQTFVIRDVQNRLWDTYAQQPLSVEQTAYVHSLYADMVGVNSDPAVAARPCLPALQRLRTSQTRLPRGNLRFGLANPAGSFAPAWWV